MARVSKADNIPGILTFSLALSAANTFTEGELATGITPQSGFGLLVKEIQFEVSPYDGSGTAPNEVMVQIAKSSQSAEIFLDDDDLYFKWRSSAYGEAAKIPNVLNIWPVRYVPNRDLVLVSPSLFIGFDANNINAAVETLYMRLLYDTVPIKEIDALRILQG